MTAIDVGYVFRANKQIGKIRPGLHRVVEANGTRTSDDCELTIIQIPEQPLPRQKGIKQASYYARGFQTTTRFTLLELISAGAITAESPPPQSLPGGPNPTSSYCRNATSSDGSD